MRKPVIWLIAAILAIGGCKSGEEAPAVDFKYGYFPIEVGHWTIYNVDSVVWSLIHAETAYTVTYQWMELVESNFIDGQGRPSSRIECYRRDSVSQPWQIEAVWVATRTRTTAEKVEDNLRFIKLVFPPKEGKTWRGNVFIQTSAFDWLGDWEYEMIWVDEPYLFEGKIYPNTIKVLQHEENANLLQRILAYEVYALGIGMIEKELTIENRSGFGQPVTDGFSLVMKIDSTGKN